MRVLARRARWLALFTLLSAVFGCQRGSPKETLGVTRAALTGTDVLGFEDPTGWSTTTSGATLARGTTHDQGSFSLELRPSNSNGNTPIASVPISKPSTVAQKLAFDIMLPTQQPNPSWFGTAQIFLNCPSRNISNAFLAQVELTGKPLNTWTTLTFPVADSVLTQLLNGGYTDLRITVVVNVPVPTSGVYRLDNLRFIAAKPSECPGRPNGTSCDDSSLCTSGETCQAGQCKPASNVTCTTDDCHTVGACVPATGCPAPVAKANGTSCNDNNACTQTDKCQSGVCTGTNPVTCTAADVCHVAGTCDRTTGACSQPNAPNGTNCSDGNACTQPDSCQAGICVGQGAADCVVTPRFEGIASVGGVTQAVFSYTNASNENVHVAYGSDNSLSDANGFLSTPPVAVPEWFLSANHPGALVVPMTTNTLTWTIRRLSATATLAGPTLTTHDTPRGPTADLPDGSHVPIGFDPGYGVAPTDTIAAGLTVGKTDGAFAVTADGASTYKIPLWVSPGRGGAAPSLALSYNSRSGAGHFGVGWGLAGVSQIAHCDKNVATDQVAAIPKFATGDALCLDGKRLLLVSGSGGDGSEYWEMESSFNRVIQHGELSSAATFDVLHRDGSVATYGGGNATVSPPSLFPILRRRELAWSISSERDLAGNLIRYSYIQSTATDADSLLQGKPEYLLDRIDYVLTGAGQTTPTRSVSFTYEPLAKQLHRLEWLVPMPVRSRVKTVQVIGPNPSSPGVLREYRLAYATGALSGRDVLSSVTECEGPSGVCKRPTKFYYSDDASPQYELHSGSFPEISVDVKPTCCIDGTGTCCNQDTSQRTDAIVVDLNGDGLDDVIYAFNDYIFHSVDTGADYPGPSHFVCRLSDGHGLGAEIDLTNQIVANATLPLYVADLNGDGKTDVLAAVGNPNTGIPHDYYAFYSTTDRTTPAGGSSPNVQFARSSAPLLVVQTNYNSQAVFKSHPYFADMDGDGLVDVLQGTAELDPNNSQRRLAMDWNVMRGRPDGSLGAPVLGLSAKDGFIEAPGQFPHETVIATRLQQQSGLQFLIPTKSHVEDHGDGVISAWNDLSALAFDFHDSVAVTNPTVTDDIVKAPVMLDLNGDGLPEMVQVTALVRAVACTETPQGCVEDQAVLRVVFDRNIGGLFLEDQDTGLNTHWADAGLNAWHMDYNEDGADDLVLLRELRDNGILTDWGARKVGVFESSQVGLNAPHPVFSGGTGSSNRIGSLYRENAVNYSVGLGGVNPYAGGHLHNATPLDVNGDGLTDILVGPNVYVRQGGRVDLLTGVVDGIGHDVLVKYRSLGDRDPIDAKNEIPSSHQIPFYSHTEEVSYPLFGTDKSVWAVAEVDIDDGLSTRDEDPANCGACGRSGSGTYNRFLYGYENARVSVTNGEWLGFTKRTIMDVTRGMTTVTAYDTVSMVGSDFFFARFKPTSEEVTIDLPAHDAAVHANEAVRYRKVTYTGYDAKPVFSFRNDIVAVLPASMTIEESDTGGSFKLIRRVDRTFVYDDYGNVTTETEAYGDGHGEVLERNTQYENRTTGAQWLLGLPTHVTSTSTPKNGDPPVTQFTDHTYDAAGQLQTETIEPDDSALYLQTVFEHDAFGNVTAATASDSHGAVRRTEYAYDSDGVYRIRERNALGHVKQLVYHSGYGQPVFAIDPNGAVGAYRFDRFLRVKGTEHADGSSTSVTYARGPTVSTTTSDNHFSSRTLDRLGRVVDAQSRAFDGRLSSTTKTYSRLGQLVSATEPFFSGEQPRTTFTFAHDGRDRVTMKRITDNQNVVVSDSFSFYDGQDELSVDAIVSTEEGVVRPVHLVTTDDHGRAIQAVDYKDSSESAGVTTTYSYGAFGAARTIQNAAPTGPMIQAYYDRRGHVIARTDPDSGTTQFVSDAWGEEISETDAKLQTTTSDRDALGRVFARHSPLGESGFEWDSAPFGVGRLASSSSEDGAGASEVGRVYDVAGHVLRETYVVHDEPFVIDYAYNQTGPQIGKLLLVSYPPIPGRTDPIMVETRYGTNGDASALAPPGSGSTYFRIVGKDASSRVTEELFGSDLHRTRGYEPLFGGLATAHADRQGTILQDLNVAYDYRGNVMSRVDNAPGLGPVGVAETFDYDALARLRFWNSNTGAFSVEYQYDDIGNLTQRQITHNGTAGAPEVYSYGERGAGPHQLTTAPFGTYQYDVNGDQTQAPGRTAEFAPFHLPLSVTTTSQSDHFEYDAVHQRTFKTSVGSTTTYAGSDYERRKDAQGTHHVIHLRLERRELAELQVDESTASASPRATYLLDDHLGSPVVILDSSGSVTRPRYEPFGQRLADGDVPNGGSSGNPAVHFGLTGHEYDDDIGLINMRGRLYDPRIRRFLSPDPVVDNPFSSQAYNRYSYVANNPLSRIDPTGFTANANGGSSVNYQFSQTDNPGQSESGDPNAVSVTAGASDDFSSTGAEVIYGDPNGGAENIEITDEEAGTIGGNVQQVEFEDDDVYQDDPARPTVYGPGCFIREPVRPRSYDMTRINKDVDPMRILDTSPIFQKGEQAIMLVATGAVVGAYGAVAETAAGKAAVRALQGAVNEVVSGVLSEKQGKEIALNALLSAAYGAADPLETDSAVLKGAFDSVFKTLIKGAANKLAFDKEFDLRTLPVSAATGAAGPALGSARTPGDAVSLGTQKGTMSAAAKALLP